MKSVQGHKPVFQLSKYTKKVLGFEDLRASFHQQIESAFGNKQLNTYYTCDKLKSQFRI